METSRPLSPPPPLRPFVPAQSFAQKLVSPSAFRAFKALGPAWRRRGPLRQSSEPREPRHDSGGRALTRRGRVVGRPAGATAASGPAGAFSSGAGALQSKSNFSGFSAVSASGQIGAVWLALEGGGERQDRGAPAGTEARRARCRFANKLAPGLIVLGRPRAGEGGRRRTKGTASGGFLFYSERRPCAKRPAARQTGHPGAPGRWAPAPRSPDERPLRASRFRGAACAGTSARSKRRRRDIASRQNSLGRPARPWARLI